MTDTPGTPVPKPAIVWPGVPVPRRFDIALVAFIGAFYAAALLTSSVPRDELVFVIPWCIATLTPLLWRTQAPLIALVLVSLLLWVTLAVLGTEVMREAQFIWIGPLVAVGAVAARCPLRVSMLGLSVAFVSLATFVVAVWPASPEWDVFSIAVACAVAWGLGFLARLHHQRIEELRDKQAQTRDAVQLERSRIALDLNDIIRSAVSRMRRDAADARQAINGDRERAIGALSAIEATGIEVMHELRRLLHVLHDDPSLIPVEEPVQDPGTRATVASRLKRVTRSDISIAAVSIGASIVFASLALDGAAALFACVFFALGYSVLVWRHRFPIVVFMVVIAVHAIAVVLFHGGDFVWNSFTEAVPVLVALAAVAGGTAVWVSLPVLMVAWVYMAVPTLEYPDVIRNNLMALTFITLAVWVAGFLAGRRRRQIAQLEVDEVAAARAVQRERTRLAYELHDVVGHSVTVMVLQAAGAVRIMDRDPARAAEALPAIEASGEEAAQELERFIGLLSESGGSSVEPRSERVLGLADLDDLVERIQPTVNRIGKHVSGVPRRLESSVDWAAYCVVREALANAVKHAGPEAQVDISVSWADDLVLVRVGSSHGVRAQLPSSDLSGGYGLVSLRERVQVAGGELRWSEDGGVFTVDASFPLTSELKVR